MIVETYEAIDALEDSHISNMKLKTRKASGYEDISEIQNNFKKKILLLSFLMFIFKRQTGLI